MTEIGDALRGARAYLTDHPDEARYRDSAATARIEAGLAVTVDGPDGATLRTDMPASIGGGGTAATSSERGTDRSMGSPVGGGRPMGSGRLGAMGQGNGLGPSAGIGTGGVTTVSTVRTVTRGRGPGRF